MSILKATLRHLLRRKWILTLVVVLFGMALVVLTHVYDVAGIIEARPWRRCGRTGDLRPKNRSRRWPKALESASSFRC